MATQRHNTLVLTQQSPDRDVIKDPFRRFRFDLGCRNAADVRARAALVLSWRDRVWPPRRPTPALPPARQPEPAPQAQAPVLADLSRQPADCGGSIPAPAVPGRITVRHVVEVTAAHFKTTAEALRSSIRTQPLVRRRQIAEYVAHKLTGRSLPYIAGKLAAGRDHTTTLHSVRTIKALIDAGDADTIVAVDGIVAEVTGGAR